MIERWLTLRLESSGRIAFVLDASESAQPHREGISRLTLDLLNVLPKTRQAQVFFLGNAEPLAAAEFARQGRRWYQANSGRASIISPVFERLQKEEDTTVVVLGAGKIFDLEDWRDTPLLQRTVFVRWGEAPLTGGLSEEWEPSLEQLRMRLDNPITRVELPGRVGMPFFWDNDAYQWEGDKLVAERAKKFAVRVGLLVAPKQAESLRYEGLVTLADGGKRLITLEPCDPPALASDWKVLTQEEGETFRQCVREGKYHCPICTREHGASELRCEEGGLLGTPIYPTLAGLRGFVLLRDVGGQVKFRCHGCAALRIGKEAVAVRSGGYADVYRYDAVSGVWCKSGERVKQYQLLEEETYAILL